MNISALPPPHSAGSLPLMTLLALASLFLFAQEASPQPASGEPTEAPLAPVDASSDARFLDTAAALAGINTALNGIETLRARFIQANSLGQAIGGELLIARPGRLRFDYDDPSPITVIADGSTVAMADSDLETIDRAPLRATPLWWLLQSDIDLERDTRLVEIAEEFGDLYVTVEDPDNQIDGQIQLVFDGEDYSLREWYVFDALGEITRVTLSDIETGVRISNREFVIPDEESGRDERRSRRG